MKYYWLAIIPAVALGGLNTMYDALPGSGGSLASVERKCNSLAAQADMPRDQARHMCSCITRKARGWRDDNPDAEYTRDIHMRLSATCINQAERAHIVSQSKKPRKLRASRPGEPPSDWGGKGFAEEGAWDGEE